MLLLQFGFWLETELSHDAFKNAKTWAGVDPKQSADWRVSTDSRTPQYSTSKLWVISNTQLLHQIRSSIKVIWAVVAVKIETVAPHSSLSFFFLFFFSLILVFCEALGSLLLWPGGLTFGLEERARGTEWISWLWANTLIGLVSESVSHIHLKTKLLRSLNDY